MQSERALQSEIMLRLRAGGWPIVCLPIPNSIYFPARTDAERSIIGRVIAQMKHACQLVPGAPDLVLLWQGGGACIELKRPRTKTLLRVVPAGKPSEAQVAFEDRAVAAGIPHAYCTSWAEVRERLAAWGAPIEGAKRGK